MTEPESIRFYFQVMMWSMGGGFAVIFSLLWISWNGFNKRMDKLEALVLDIDRRLCRIEGAISNKDCCMIKEEKSLKKAE